MYETGRLSKTQDHHYSLEISNVDSYFEGSSIYDQESWFSQWLPMGKVIDHLHVMPTLPWHINFMLGSFVFVTQTGNSWPVFSGFHKQYWWIASFGAGTKRNDIFVCIQTPVMNHISDPNHIIVIKAVVAKFYKYIIINGVSGGLKVQISHCSACRFRIMWPH